MDVTALSQQLSILLKPNLNNDYEIRPDNVYQEGSAANRTIIGRFVGEYMLPGSRINNPNALKELYKRCQADESCLILSEHYSNLDFPLLFHLIEIHPLLGSEVAESLLPIRGAKLSETTPLAATMSYSYDSIIIYPSRTLSNIRDPEEREEYRKISTPINHAAAREMINRKNRGRIILVFPAGTRYRPWAPNTLKGVREIHSYVKTFDNILFLGINGNALPPHASDDMTHDMFRNDLVIYTCSEVIKSRNFRKRVASTAPEGTDSKQHVADEVMKELARIHSRIEPERLKELATVQPAE